MRKKAKRVLKIGSFLLVLEILLFSSGYIYLDSKLNEITVNDFVESVPYYTQIPENKTVLFRICQDEILLNLNFSEELINLVFLESEAKDYGFSVDSVITCDYEMVGYFVDVAGGIEIGNLRYTGVQITELLEYNEQNISFKKTVAKNIIKGIANNGFTKENLLYIIENSETDLGFAESFYWVDFIPKLCRFARLVN